MTAIVFCWIFPVLWKDALSNCRSVQGETCCSGSFWNKDMSLCEKCPLGYHDINCSGICIFPSYGEDCQKTCKCVLGLCDYRYGCRDLQGISDYDIASVRNTTTNADVATTSNKAESTPSRTNFTDMPNLFLYLIAISVVIFLILCGLFVGTYFYKHCVRQMVIAGKKGHGDLPHGREAGYSDLGVDTHQQSNHPVDLEYLEPVNSHKTNYDEINEQQTHGAFRF